ncbi:Hypothetical protein NTJ_11306 [Nesidiocoris tenuis]|uniref:Integrase catalytic domain-containing protein n=1 Tax=Nesidiocoris tenuis TaxID=355587 RepID=A0ABN7B5Q4_9HEMI|nr:Hypothetical protein NTJ_11306 [Nesidiocoris tenuis]
MPLEINSGKAWNPRSYPGGLRHTMDLLNRKFHEFAMDYGFQVKTSSPHFSQSNGFIKSEVKNLKSHLLKSEDPFKVLLMLRTTSLANGYSSAELLMGRKLRGLVPQAPGNLMPLQVNLDNLFNFEEMRINAQKRNFNQHHGSRPLLPLEAGKEVFVTDRQQSGIVLKEHEAPRSYLVKPKTECIGAIEGHCSHTLHQRLLTNILVALA